MPPQPLCGTVCFGQLVAASDNCPTHYKALGIKHTSQLTRTTPPSTIHCPKRPTGDQVTMFSFLTFFRGTGAIGTSVRSFPGISNSTGSQGGVFNASLFRNQKRHSRTWRPRFIRRSESQRNNRPSAKPHCWWKGIPDIDFINKIVEGRNEC